MKKNQELIHYEGKIKLNKKNYLVIIIPIILVILLIVVIALYVFIYTSPSNKIKNYLIDSGYNCNNKNCSKELDDSYYTFDFKNYNLRIDNEEYNLMISINSPTLEIKSKEYICNYIKDNYSTFTHVDNTFIYNQQCEKYITNVNDAITYYEKIITDNKIDVKKIEK